MAKLQFLLPLLALTSLSACSIWASNGDYDFVDSECTQDLECPGAAFASPTCNAGRCELVCEAGRADCDDAYANGCEADLESVESCGMCGIACEAAIGNMSSCEAGACVVDCNAAEFLDCDMSDANGCEVDGTTSANCGACGRRCADGEFCNADSGTYDCAVSCDAPRTACGDACVDTDVNRLHCGSCGNTCGNQNTTMASTCLGGGCVLNCAEGYDDCDGDPTNGCETPLDSADHCGACGRECSANNANPLCDTGGAEPTCTIIDCSAGYEDCNADALDGCEVYTDMEAANCGSCGRVCGDQNTSVASECAAGMCVLSCAANFDDCDNDPTNGCETSTLTLASCGVCAAGRSDCNMDLADGCEIDSATDTNNCGGCGVVCGSQNTTTPSQCGAGGCQLACVLGYQDADGDPSNGCEALDAIDVAGSWYHTCTLSSSGEVFCSGRDTYGAIGPLTPSLEVPNPRRIVFADDTPIMAVALSAGEQHTCAIDTAGHLYCWGRNTDLRIGQSGTTNHSEYPVAVTADPAEETAFMARTFVQLRTYHRHSCALDDQGGVWCWGNAFQGALGLGDEVDALARLVPLPLPAVNVATGFKNSAAILNDGRVYGWGSNDFGAFGLDPASTPSLLNPTELFVGTTVRELALGTSFACFIDTSDVLRCLGRNGEMRLGSAGGDTVTPRPVTVTGTPQSLFAGPSHACALTTTGLVCWGRNDEGEVGGGTATNNGLLPTDVVFPAGVTPDYLSTNGYYNACAIAGGQAYCWGYNAADNLNVSDDEWTAVGRPEAPDESALPLIDVTAGSEHGCGATTDALYCWGNSTVTMRSTALDRGFHHEPLAVPLPTGVTSVVSLAAGMDHTCFVGNNGVAYCSGDNNRGELGVVGGRQNEPTPVPLPPGIFEIAASVNSTCARTATSVYCFGEDAPHPTSLMRDLDGVSGGSTVTTPVANVANPVQLAAGRAFGCALLSGGEVRCWGWDNAGQRGDGADDDGVVNLPMAAVSIAAGTGHACAVLVDTSVMCWGSASFGRVGAGNATSVYLDPVAVVDSANMPITGAVDVGVTEITSCAVLADGRVMCWGDSRHGQLGTFTSTDHAVLRPDITDAESVNGGSASSSDTLGGAAHLCFLRSGADMQGPVGCIGNRNDGRMGDMGAPPRITAPRIYRSPL